MAHDTFKIQLILTLTIKNLYCHLFQEGHLSETFVFSSIDPFNNAELKEFLDLHRGDMTWMVLDLPDLKIEHLKLHHLPWWKKQSEIIKNRYKRCFYFLPPGLPYSHGLIHFESSFWKEWNFFIDAQKYLYRDIIPLPLLWSHFPFKKYTSKNWQIVLWKTPEDGLRYFAFFQQALVYSRLVKEVPFNLEEEIFNLYTYLQRTYDFNPSASVLMVIDFDPDQSLAAFQFEQDPIVINKAVLLQQAGIPGENLIYAFQHQLIKSFERPHRGVDSIGFFIRFFVQNQQAPFFKNLNKGLLVVLVYFLIRGVYLYYQSQTLQRALEVLNEKPVVHDQSRMVPENVIKSIMDSVPPDSGAVISFLERLKIFRSSSAIIEGWEWETLSHPDQYKISMRVQVNLAEGEDKKRLFKMWKEHFQPLVVTILKKKILKKASAEDAAQQWLIEMTIETTKT